MNTTHWHQMFSDIRNKNQIRCLQKYFLIARVTSFNIKFMFLITISVGRLEVWKLGR